jgi:hypothetical protein
MNVKKLIDVLKKCDPKSDINIVIRGKTIDDDIWADRIQDVQEYTEDEGKWVVIDVPYKVKN